MTWDDVLTYLTPQEYAFVDAVTSPLGLLALVLGTGAFVGGIVFGADRETGLSRGTTALLICGGPGLFVLVTVLVWSFNSIVPTSTFVVSDGPSLAAQVSRVSGVGEVAAATLNADVTARVITFEGTNAAGRPASCTVAWPAPVEGVDRAAQDLTGTATCQEQP